MSHIMFPLCFYFFLFWNLQFKFQIIRCLLISYLKYLIRNKMHSITQNYSICHMYLFTLSSIHIFNIFRANMALILSYVAQPTQISFHLFLTHLDWDYNDNGIQSGSGELAMEIRASIP